MPREFDVTPVFLLSLPRSGSTLLQRLLVSHPSVASAPETWILLPLFYSTRKESGYAEYSHHSCADGINEFISRLPRARRDYLAAVNAYAQTMYNAACSQSERLFIEKTPRYALIGKPLFEAFPDAYFIFLWRNPLSVAASLSKTWGKGRWPMHRYRVDLEDGLAGLTQLRAAVDSGGGRFIDVTYDKLVQTPESALVEITSFLDLESHGVKQERRTVDGALGDAADQRKTTQILPDSSGDAYTDAYFNSYRRRWAKRYLNTISDDTLNLTGTNRTRLMDSLTECGNTQKGLLKDIGFGVCDYIWRLLQVVMLAKRIRRILRRERWNFLG